MQPASPMLYFSASEINVTTCSVFVVNFGGGVKTELRRPQPDVNASCANAEAPRTVTSLQNSVDITTR